MAYPCFDMAFQPRHVNGRTSPSTRRVNRQLVVSQKRMVNNIH